MHVVIAGVAQGLSFETGESSNYVTLLLPNGRKIMASVAGEDVEELTVLFLKSGGPAAQAAMAKAAAAPAAAPAPPAADYAQAEAEAAAYARMMQGNDPQGIAEAPVHDGAFSPMNFADGGSSDEETISTFGGDLDPELAAVGRSLQQAETKIAHAIGDTSLMGPAELRQVVSRIQEAAPAMPTPKFAVQQPPQGRRLSGPKVQADDMGNPVISGPGRVDHHALAGGDTTGEEDVGSI